MPLNKKDKNMNMLNRVVGDSFSPNVYITFNPHQCNCSSMWLLFNFKQALGRFYQNVLKHKRFYKHKDQQYPLIVFLENGKNRDIGENNPHLHVLVQLPIDKKKAFVDAIYDMLKQEYPSLTKDDKLINTTDDLVGIWNYNDKEQAEFDMNPRMKANKIFTISDFQKPIHFDKTNKYEKIEEWFKSEPVFLPVQQPTNQHIEDIKQTEPDKQPSALHKFYNRAKSIFTAPINYVAELLNQCLLYYAYTLPVAPYYRHHISRQFYDTLDDLDSPYR